MVGEEEGNFPVPAALAAWLPCHAQQVVDSPERKRMLCERKREQSLNHICCVFLFCRVKFCYLCFFLFLFYLGNKCRCTSLPGNAERFLLLLVLQGCVSFLSSLHPPHLGQKYVLCAHYYFSATSKCGSGISRSSA